MAEELNGANVGSAVSAPTGPIASDEIRGVCPLDLLPLDPLPVSSADSVKRAVAAARSAHHDWARTPFDKRSRMLEAAARSLLDDRGQLIDLVRLEMGKLEVDALFTEGLGPLDAVRSWSRIIKEALKEERVRLNPLAFPRKSASIRLLPRGVMGTIAPWNFPAAGLYRSVFPALLLGNGLVVKPSRVQPSVQRLVRRATGLGSSPGPRRSGAGRRKHRPSLDQRGGRGGVYRLDRDRSAGRTTVRRTGHPVLDGDGG